MFKTPAPGFEFPSHLYDLHGDHVHMQRLIPDQLVLSMSCFDDVVQGWRRRQHSVPKVRKKVTQWHGLCAV